MPIVRDSPGSSLFTPLIVPGTVALTNLPVQELSATMCAVAAHAPSGDCVCWARRGSDKAARRYGDARLCTCALVGLHAHDGSIALNGWAGWNHLADAWGRPARQLAATYVFQYADGSEVFVPIRHRHEVGRFSLVHGDNCVQAVIHQKPFSIRSSGEQLMSYAWGNCQQRIGVNYPPHWIN